MMMKPSARRRGALALLALAGCGVAQNMGQWVGGEHCAGSHCGPSKEEKRLAREEARRLEKARAEAESEHLATVARKPAAFVLNLSGHHDHPACNGKYKYGGAANGKPQWVKEGGGGEKVFWTGTSWDCFWGGYSPEATVDTPVPPLAGYNKDRGGCDIKVRYQRVTEPEEPGEGSGGSLRKVEVGRVMSWYDYRARAKQEGGRLPTTAELRAAGVDVGYDQWTPITPSPGEQETGRRDGARGKDENAWANIGPRKYQIEYPAWGLDASVNPGKRLTYFYVVSASGGSASGARMP